MEVKKHATNGKVGETITMTFTMPADRSHFKFRGKIARVFDRGIGVQFASKLSRYQEEIIRNLLD